MTFDFVCGVLFGVLLGSSVTAAGIYLSAVNRYDPDDDYFDQQEE